MHMKTNFGDLIENSETIADMATKLEDVDHNLGKGGHGEIPDESIQSMSQNKNTKVFGIINEDNDVPGGEDDVNLDDINDVFLLVNGRRLLVSRVVLSLASPVFKTMFGGSGLAKREIELHGKKFSDVKMFYNCIDPRKMEPITDETVYNILPLADEYRVESLMKKCRVILPSLVDESMDAKGLSRHLHLAVNHDLCDLEVKCVALCSELKMKDMARWMDHFNVPASVQLKVRDLALRRHELEEEDTLVITKLFDHIKVQKIALVKINGQYPTKLVDETMDTSFLSLLSKYLCTNQFKEIYHRGLTSMATKNPLAPAFCVSGQNQPGYSFKLPDTNGDLKLSFPSYGDGSNSGNAKFSFGTKTFTTSIGTTGAPTSMTSGALFGTKTSTTAFGLFGTKTSTTAGGLFDTKISTTSGGLFGTKTSTAAGGLFDTKTSTAAGGLFGTKTSTAAGGLFDTKISTTSGGLFDTKTSTGTSGLLGTTTSTTSVGLFGTKASTTSDGLFGTETLKSDGLLGTSKSRLVNNSECNTVEDTINDEEINKKEDSEKFEEDECSESSKHDEAVLDDNSATKEIENENVDGYDYNVSSGAEASSSSLKDTPDILKVLQGMRLLYKYLPHEKSIKTVVVQYMRNQIGSLTAEEREVFDLLPAEAKLDVKGRLIKEIPDKIF